MTERLGSWGKRSSSTSHFLFPSTGNLASPQTSEGIQVNQPLLTEKEAAAFLKVSHETLKKIRYKGDGPGYIKFGRNIRYSMAALQRYLDENTH